MPQIDFYILPDGAHHSHENFICRYTAKAYRKGHRIYIYTASREQAMKIDDRLWTFQDTSFLPHQLYNTKTNRQVPILISFADNPAQLGDPGDPAHPDDPEQPGDPEQFASAILINLTPDVPPFYQRFGRIAEIVESGENSRIKARQRFRHYRAQGHSPKSHTIAG